jgi:hypothetical protein
MDEKTLFQAEMGKYLQTVSTDNPIGVCLQCGSARGRQDVNGQEACPAFLVEHLEEGIDAIKKHEWQKASSSAELESLLKNNFPSLKQIADRGSAWINS